MTCDACLDRLADGATDDEPGIAAHLAACPACTAVLAEAGAEAAPPGALEALLEGVLEDQRAERGALAWLRARPTRARRGLAGLAAAGLVIAAAAAAGRVDLAVYPAGRLVLELAVAGALVAALLGRGVAPSSVAAGGRRVWLLLAAALALPLLEGVLPAAHAAHAASVEGLAGDLGRRALGCFTAGLVVAVPMLLLLRALERLPGAVPARDALAAAAAGMVGVAALQVHCPLTAPLHLLLGHAPVVASAVVTWVALRRLADRRGGGRGPTRHPP